MTKWLMLLFLVSAAALAQLTQSGPLSLGTKAPGLNDNYDVSGFTTAAFPGIGVAQTAWASGTYPLCTAVSNSGLNYLAVGVTTGVTPGTNADIWWPVQNANTPKQLDCAFYWALGQADVNTSQKTLRLGDTNFSGPYDTAIGLVEPASAYQVNLIGSGRGFNGSPTRIRAANSGFVILTAPDKSGSLPYNIIVSDLLFDGNNISLGCLQIYGEKVGRIEHIGCVNWNPASAFSIPIVIGDGTTPFLNGGYQLQINDIFVSGNGNAPASLANVTVAPSGGAPVFTVVSGGSYVNPPTHMSFWGFGATGGVAPCTTIGTLTPTYTGSGPYVLTGVTVSGFSGCAGTMYAYVPDMTLAPYGIEISLITDSTFTDLVVANAGWKYGIFYNGSSSNTMVHEHVYGGSDIQIEDNNENVHVGLECDSSVHLCAEASASSGNAVFQGTQLVQGGGAAQNKGVVGFHMPNGGAILQTTCGNNATSSNVFNLVLGFSGPIAHAGNYGLVNVVNGEQCDTLTRDNSFSTGLQLPSLSIAGTGPGLITPAPYSVAGTPLPTCNSTTNVNAEAVVSDATSPTYLGAYTGSGTVHAPVFCDGTSWKTY